MKLQYLFKPLIFILLFIAQPTSSLAKLSLYNGDDDNALHFTLGIGGRVAVSPYGEETVKPQLTAGIEWNRFFMDTSTLGYDFSHWIGNGALTTTVSIHREDKLDLPSGKVFTGLQRKGYFAADLNIAYDWADNLAFQANITSDISHRHNGVGATFFIGKTINWEPFILQTQIGVGYEDRKLSQYHYGVYKQEANEHRQAYKAEAHWVPIIQTYIIYPLSEQGMLLGNLGYKYLPKSIKNSPLVKKQDLAEIGLSYIYAF